MKQNMEADMTTDALVRELREAFRVADGETLYIGHPKVIAHRAADSLTRLQSEVERLTRERDSAQQSNENWMRECLEARAERDAARRELAECRNKALEEVKTMVSGMYRGLAYERYGRDYADDFCKRIEALKTEA